MEFCMELQPKVIKWQQLDDAECILLTSTKAGDIYYQITPSPRIALLSIVHTCIHRRMNEAGSQLLR